MYLILLSGFPQANLGNMDSRSEQWSMIFGNMSLIQAQAIVVGFLASIAAMVMGWIPEGKFNISHGFLLCTSSVLTASFASLVLGKSNAYLNVIFDQHIVIYDVK